MSKLSDDLEISVSLLRRCMQFAETFNIRAARRESFPGELSWAHFRALLAAPDEKSRTELTQRTKKFVESGLAGVPCVIIRSSRSDKYARYLADIFYQTKSGEAFLNNRLLEHRLAWRV